MPDFETKFPARRADKPGDLAQLQEWYQSLGVFEFAGNARFHTDKLELSPDEFAGLKDQDWRMLRLVVGRILEGRQLMAFAGKTPEEAVEVSEQERRRITDLLTEVIEDLDRILDAIDS